MSESNCSVLFNVNMNCSVLFNVNVNCSVQCQGELFCLILGVLFNKNCSEFQMDKSKNCSACIIKLDKGTYKKHKTICKNRYNEKERKNRFINTLTQIQQPKKVDVSTNNNKRTPLVGPSFSGETVLMLKIFPQKLLNRDFYIFTESPLQLYSNSKIGVKEITEDIKL